MLMAPVDVSFDVWRRYSFALVLGYFALGLGYFVGSFAS